MLSNDTCPKTRRFGRKSSDFIALFRIHRTNGMFSYMNGWFFMVNVGKYTIHGLYGYWGQLDYKQVTLHWHYTVEAPKSTTHLTWNLNTPLAYGFQGFSNMNSSKYSLVFQANSHTSSGLVLGVCLVYLVCFWGPNNNTSKPQGVTGSLLTRCPVGS